MRHVPRRHAPTRRKSRHCIPGVPDGASRNMVDRKITRDNPPTHPTRVGIAFNCPDGNIRGAMPSWPLTDLPMRQAMLVQISDHIIAALTTPALFDFPVVVVHLVTLNARLDKQLTVTATEANPVLPECHCARFPAVAGPFGGCQ
jgi:hypothetical protein